MKKSWNAPEITILARDESKANGSAFKFAVAPNVAPTAPVTAPFISSEIAPTVAPTVAPGVAPTLF